MHSHGMMGCNAIDRPGKARAGRAPFNSLVKDKAQIVSDLARLCLPAPWRLVYQDSVGSTNDLARELVTGRMPAPCGKDEGPANARRADGGRFDRLVLAAGEQRCGRGRFRRRWISVPGNLYFTAILAEKPSWPDVTGLSLVAGLAIAETAERFVRVPVALKWPNDALLGGAKFCGILIERHGGCVLLGVGVNIAGAPAHTGGVFPATFLQGAADRPVTAALFLSAFVEVYEKWLAAWQAGGGLSGKLRAACHARLWRRGEVISVSGDGMSGRAMRGINRGIDEAGRLLVEHEGGLARIHAADILPAAD